MLNCLWTGCGGFKRSPEMMLTEIYLTIFSGASQPGHANVAACRHFRALAAHTPPYKRV